MTGDNVTFQTNNVVLSKNYSSTEQVNSIQQLLAYDLIAGTEDEKFRFLPGFLSNYNFTKDPSKVLDIKFTTHMIVVNSQKDSMSPLLLAANPKKGKSQTVTPTLPKLHGPEIPGALSKKSKRPKSKRSPTKTMVTPPKLTKGSEQSHSVFSGTDELEKESDEEEVIVVGDDMDEDPQDDAEVRTSSPNQTKPELSHVQESASNSSTSMSSLDKSSFSISDLYKGLNVITELLKYINNVVKDDPVTNKKIDEAIKTFAKISTYTTKILSLVKAFDFSTLQSTMKDLQAHALKQEEASAAWTKFSTNLA
nr:hypothetical protein [Tanacetum cinerariifolium]